MSRNITIPYSRTIGMLVMLSIAAMASIAVIAQTPKKLSDDTKQEISSKIQKTKAGELILVETVIIPAPVGKVWAAYTTSAGYTSWAAAVAKVDLRVGGTIGVRCRRIQIRRRSGNRSPLPLEAARLQTKPTAATTRFLFCPTGSLRSSSPSRPLFG